MAASILVAYATRYGSTQGVGDAVGARLRERGLAAAVRRAREVRSLDGFNAVVLGSPLYIGSLLRKHAGSWSGTARRFDRCPSRSSRSGPCLRSRVWRVRAPSWMPHSRRFPGSHLPQRRCLSAGTIRPDFAFPTRCWPPCSEPASRHEGV